MSNTTNEKPVFRALSPVTRNKKTFYVEIGAAWSSEKGGYNIRLNALPLGDTIILRPHKEKDEASATDAE